MRLALVIFKKDIRHLWWEVTVVAGILGVLTVQDLQRHDYIAGPMESLLNWLVPAAWYYLLAMAVHQESPASDRQFWLTRPYPRGWLFAAKMFFAVVAIHVPAIISECIILIAHGFSPLTAAPHLFAKQALIAATVTLPGIAIASVTANLAQFAISALAASGTAILLSRAVDPFYAPWISVDQVRRTGALGIVAIICSCIIALQYARRFTFGSCTILGAGLLLTGVLYTSLPQSLSLSIECALLASDRPEIDIRLSTQPSQQNAMGYSRLQNVFELPLVIRGVPPGTQPVFAVTTSELRDSRGTQLTSTAEPPSLQRLRRAFFTFIRPGDGGFALSIVVGRELTPHIADPVSISGRAQVTIFKKLASTRMALTSGTQAVPGLGHCATDEVENLSSGSSMLKVLCESPGRIRATTVTVLASNGDTWRHMLGDSMPGLDYRPFTWLSPVHRSQTFFHIVEGPQRGAGGHWLVSRSSLPGATVLLEPVEPSACAVANYTFSNIRLHQYKRE